jgi:hypothetical protein
MCVTQHICPESQNVSIAFSGLTAITRAFFTEHSLQTLSPGLPVFYAELSLALDAFCRHCTLVFSNQGKSLATGLVRPGNMLYDLGKKLTLMWMDFISKINDLAQADVEPYRSQIRQQFAVFFGCIDQVNEGIARTQFLSHHLADVMQRFRGRTARCQQMILGTFDLAQSEDLRNGETDVAEKKVMGLLRRSKQLFETEIPLDALPIREKFKMRSTLLNVCAVILEILAAVGRFHRQIAEIRERISEVNDEMTRLNESVHLPFKLTLSAAAEPQKGRANQDDEWDANEVQEAATSDLNQPPPLRGDEPHREVISHSNQSQEDSGQDAMEDPEVIRRHHSDKGREDLEPHPDGPDQSQGADEQSGDS